MRHYAAACCTVRRGGNPLRHAFFPKRLLRNLKITSTLQGKKTCLIDRCVCFRNKCLNWSLLLTSKNTFGKGVGTEFKDWLYWKSLIISILGKTDNQLFKVGSCVANYTGSAEAPDKSLIFYFSGDQSFTLWNSIILYTTEKFVLLQPSLSISID